MEKPNLKNLNDKVAYLQVKDCVSKKEMKKFLFLMGGHFRQIHQSLHLIMQFMIFSW